MASIWFALFTMGRMENVFRLDFNGQYSDFRRTPQGFLRVNARLTKTGIFTYDQRREYRSDDEVFRTDSLESLKGAPVTDLHPSERGADAVLTSANAKTHMVGLTESIERDGSYLKGSLIIFHEETIKAIESGERKEISLGYQCQLDPTPGIYNGEAYDAVQTNIIINHVALGPKGWGRAGPDCSIHTDSKNLSLSKEKLMIETIRLDGIDVALTADSITALITEKKRQLQEVSGRLDAVGQELEKERQARVALEDPKLIEAKLQARLKLVERCRTILGNDIDLEGKSDEELKLAGLKHVYPDLDVADKEPAYLDGMFEALVGFKTSRNDSLANTRQAIHSSDQKKSNQAYEKWVEQSAKLWQAPLTGRV